MSQTASLSLILLGLLNPFAQAVDWKPAPSPLMTRWGKAVTPANAWQEYPRPQLVRKDWLNLNGLWDYALVAKESARPEKWDGKILVPFAIESSLSGVGKRVSDSQALWYRKSFQVPPEWKDKRVLLHFEAVDWQATVFINGKEMVGHLGGSDPFHLDITPALKNGPCEVTVRVWDPTDKGAQPRGKQVNKPGGIWYTPVTGIWQTVWAEPVDPVHILALQATADLQKSEVEFIVHTAGECQSVMVCERGGPGLKVLASGKPGQPFRMKVDNPRLWTPDLPHLYPITVAAIAHLAYSNIADQADSYFAMRTISTGKDGQGHPRLLLNGKPLFQIGPLDQGWWPDGLLTPPSEDAMRFDLDYLKKIGMNMLRKHIKVEPARLYHHCDKIGLLVWQDMPSGMGAGRKHFVQPNMKEDADFTLEEKKQFRKELKAMIDHLRFFPSIVTWVPFNEGWGQHDTNEILKWVKEYDPTRLVNGPSGWTDRDFGDLKDKHDYPGPGMFPVMNNRVSVLGEFGGLGLPVEGHLWQKSNNWGYRTFKTTAELRSAYQLLMARLHPLIGKGLSAAVYTQTTDVEVEVNGLLTYDREVSKLDVVETARWHKALFNPPPVFKELAATSEKKPRLWKVQQSKPNEGWEKLEFDDSSWPSKPGGFGTAMTPGAIMGTEWKTPDIWLRARVEIADLPTGEVWLRLHHDEDAEVFINGILAARVAGYTTEYVEIPLSTEAAKALKKGANLLAIHCHQTGGGQYIDAGLVQTVSTGLKTGAVPDSRRTAWNLSPFYAKHIDLEGLPLVSSKKVSDPALLEAALIVNQMLAGRADIRTAMIENKVRVVVMAPEEMTTDVPEHSDLKPKEYWDKRARGLGATKSRPAVSCGEENLLNLKGDRYPTENILVHEFAHAMHEMGLNTIDAGFDAKLREVFSSAMKKGLWEKTYATTNHKEYWAEGVQSYFNTNAKNNHNHNNIDTREKLASYDPGLFKLIDEVYGKSAWRYQRYDARQGLPRRN
ncbi:MAG: beta-galactosidase [Gemmataceae bacterium]|nr:beta-galactosidase [Gemmataceae bacterium]